MKKNILLIFLCLGMFWVANSQIGPNPNELVYKGHIIRLAQLSNNGYGYSIFFQNQLVVRQSNNPFNHSPFGLPKVDAIKLAQWQIDKLIGMPPNSKKIIRENQSIPQSVAKELKLTTN
jgi:hypothetical protein